MPTAEQLESYWTTPIRESNTTPQVICDGIVGALGPHIKALKEEVEALKFSNALLRAEVRLMKADKRRAA